VDEQVGELRHTKSVAFECVESVMKDNDIDDEEEEAVSQADGYVEGPDAQLREGAA